MHLAIRHDLFTCYNYWEDMVTGSRMGPSGRALRRLQVLVIE